MVFVRQKTYYVYWNKTLIKCIRQTFINCHTEFEQIWIKVIINQENVKSPQGNVLLPAFFTVKPNKVGRQLQIMFLNFFLILALRY